jgi:nitroreductase
MIMFRKAIDTAQPIHDVLALRWSGRAYDPARGVARAELVALLEAARWAPSCYGDQPWRYVIWDRIRDRECWQGAFDCLADGNRLWAKEAPVLMLASADSVLTRTGAANRWGQYDTGAATMALCVQATALGLMVHQMGGFDVARVRAVARVPERFMPMAMITVGYQVPEDSIPPEARERELAPRVRRPLKETFFEGGWEEAIRTD